MRHIEEDQVWATQGPCDAIQRPGPTGTQRQDAHIRTSEIGKVNHHRFKKFGGRVQVLLQDCRKVNFSRIALIELDISWEPRSKSFEHCVAVRRSISSTTAYSIDQIRAKVLACRPGLPEEKNQ